ncbi:MAG: radical SAM protein [Lachnospiraceae bacterium]|nr:radical SAM protein [Lachnospiraceae bacterium]
MKYTGLTYRPPYEADSLLLQVTAGCSHNRCSFCTMYRDVPFEEETLGQIETDLKEAQLYVPGITKVFLENGDPFCLPADRLAEIARLVRRYLPRVDRIAMYASVKNIRAKTDEELRELRSLGINELNVGVGSGLDDALVLMNKGYTAADAYYELGRLREAGIDYGANIILGCAGAGRWRENAEATARLLNETKPYLIFTGTIHAEPGCELYDDMQSGAFTEPTFGEYLDEEELLFTLLEPMECFIFGLHPANVCRMQGWLHLEREKMIETIRRRRKGLEAHLDERPSRHGGEGEAGIR